MGGRRMGPAVDPGMRWGGFGVTSLNQSAVRYNFEYEQKLRVAFIGAGGHAFRNVYPTFQYAPIDLVAVCDLDGSRAEAFARQFGATKSYTDHREMLASEQPDAVFIVTWYDDQGRPQATPWRWTRSRRDVMSGWRNQPPPASWTSAMLAASEQDDS